MSALHGLHARELTPRGPGGISVVEVAGAGALARVQALVPDRRVESGRLLLARLELDGEQVDEALVWAEHEARVELHVHGSPPLVRRLVEHFGASERRREDIEGHALEALGRAASEAGARVLLDQAEGALRRELEAWIELDEHSLRPRVERLLARSDLARFALEPARVVLAGPVNAGKSTLFNLLFGRERVVVSRQAGTTRDAIAERVRFGQWPIELVDTAGERELEGGHARAELEAEGQRLARAVRGTADLVLWLQPVDAWGAPPTFEGRAIVLASRADLRPGAGVGSFPRISALADPDGAVRSIWAAFRDEFGLPESFWMPGEPLAFDLRSRAGLRAIDLALRERRRSDLRARIELLLGEGDPRVEAAPPIP